MPLLIGTAGYVYPHWRHTFYPPSLPATKELSHYLSNFPTVEINATWHAFPRLQTLLKWRQTALPQTSFCLKAPKQITHINRLQNSHQLVSDFLTIALEGLGPHLGAILFQCPPSLPLSLPLLHHFLEGVETIRNETRVNVRVAMEFREKGWFCAEVYQKLAEHDVALVNSIVVSDTNFSHVLDDAFPHCRSWKGARASWGYTRFHGSKNPGVVTKFPDDVLRKMLGGIGETDYVFFLNDLGAEAVESAKRFAEIVAEDRGSSVRELWGGFLPMWKRKKVDIADFFKGGATAGTKKVGGKKNCAIGKMNKDAHMGFKPSSPTVKKNKIAVKPPIAKGKGKQKQPRKTITDYFSSATGKG